jgi:hypothetical protein
MNFRLLARWPSKDILPTSVACDTACEALRHYRRMRKNRMEVLIIVTWEGAGSREITTHRLRTLAESERAKIRRPKRRNWKAVTGSLVIVASTLPNGFRYNASNVAAIVENVEGADRHLSGRL